MAVTWDVKELKRNADGGVTYVHYCAWNEEYTGTDLERLVYQGYYDAIVEYTPNPEADGFTDFDDLTKEQVIGWVKNTIGADMVTTIEDAVATQIANKKAAAAPVVMPWE